MKKATLGILFATLITFSCIFYSCTTEQGTANIPEETDTTEQEYIAAIQDLENRIIELQQNQYISDADRNSEIARLELLISELRKNTNDSETSTTPDSNTPDETIIASEFFYEISDNNAKITGYSGTETVIAIPYSIDGYTVTEIADNAFENNHVTDIIIPNSVTKIGWFAFKACSSLKTVTVPPSVQSIGYSAFPLSSKNLTILCRENSLALDYAKSYGINYTII